MRARQIVLGIGWTRERGRGIGGGRFLMYSAVRDQISRCSSRPYFNIQRFTVCAKGTPFAEGRIVKCSANALAALPFIEHFRTVIQTPVRCRISFLLRSAQCECGISMYLQSQSFLEDGHIMTRSKSSYRGFLEEN